MKHLTKRKTAYALMACILLTAGGMHSTKADDVVYTEETVSITSAVDRFIEAGSIGLMQKKDLAIGNARAITETFRQETAPVPQVDMGSGAVLPLGLDFSDKALVVAQSAVNIREEGSVDAKRVGSINCNGLVTVKQKGDEWSLITSGGCEGYIKNEFLLFGSEAAAYAEANLTKMARVTASSLRVRESASEDSKCLTQIPQGEQYAILNVGAEWTKIAIDNSLSGYVKNEFIVLSYQTCSAVVVNDDPAPETPVAQTPQQPTTQEPSTQAPATEAPATEAPATQEPTTQAPASVPTSSTGDAIASYALQFEGNPYVYGGSSLTNGTDCSGFTMSIYAAFGISIPRTADSQATVGQEVSLSALYPGDLIFYDHGNGSINHVALYIGNGQVIHASTPSTGIIIANINYRTPCKAVRIVY